VPAPPASSPRASSAPPSQGPFRSSLSLGTVAGIEIRIHASFWLLVLLVVVGSSAEGTAAVLGALGWLAAIFGSVLLHELAHCVVATRRGARVRAIVLLPIGGVSQLEHMVLTSRDEMAMAAAGPLTSLALALAAGVVAVASGADLARASLISGPLLLRFAAVNAMLGAFNLLPAFPLDGGRLLRAGLERRRTLEEATAIAAMVGRSLAIVMGAVGVLVDLWLVIIAVFVWFGAGAEEASTLLHARLRKVSAGAVAHPAVVVEAVTPAGLAAATAAGAGCRDAVVVDGDGAVLGVASLVALVAADAGAPASTAAVPGGATVDASTPMDPDGLEVIIGAPHLVVTDHGEIIGVMRARDVERAAAR
jgi:stage IV sporulation protein FB